MFKFIDTLVEIRDEIRLVRKILAKAINIPDSELNFLSPNTKMDYSEAQYIEPKSEEELIQEEDNELVAMMDNKLADAERTGRVSFYVEDNVSGVQDTLNES